MAGLHSLDHVVVVVADLERAAADYAKILGAPPVWRGVHPGQGTANVLFSLANTYIELLAPCGEGLLGEALRRRLGDSGEGLMALAFGTEDADATAGFLRHRGIDAGTPQPGSGRVLDGQRERRWRTLMLPTESTRGVMVIAIEHLSPPLPAAAANGEPGAAVNALDHVVIFSANLDDSRRLYGDLLGLRLALDREFEERRLRLLFFRVGGVTVEIGGRLGATASADGSDTLWGMAYRVDDVEAARTRLLAAGVDVTAIREGHKEGTRVCTIRDGTHGVATLLITAGDVDG